MGREMVSLLFWLVLSAFTCIASLRIGLGSVGDPGPGFLPFYVSLAVAALAIILFLKDRGNRALGGTEAIFGGRNAKNIIYAISFILAYGMLLERIGFLLCTLFFVAACLKIIGSKKLPAVIVISIGIALGAYVLFELLLSIQVPEGDLIKRFLPYGGFQWR